MPALPWKDEYLINVAVIDEQHKRLAELSGRVHEILESNPQGGQEIRHMVDELIDFTRLHFATEEDLMRKYQYPGYEAHRAAHKQVLYRLGTLAELSEQPMRLATRIDPDASDDWVTSHLLEKDAHLGEFLNEKGVF